MSKLHKYATHDPRQIQWHLTRVETLQRLRKLKIKSVLTLLFWLPLFGIMPIVISKGLATHPASRVCGALGGLVVLLCLIRLVVLRIRIWTNSASH